MHKLCLFFLLVLNTRIPAQTTWHVRQTANGQNTGLSWNDAFTDLHEALQAANAGDAVWVAGGMYRPTADTDRSARFILKSGVRLLGGFAGSETLETQRDWQNNPTVLDGDIGMPGDSADNVFTLVYLKNPDGNTAIDGLTFQLGNADQAGQSGHTPGVCGGAIFIDGQDGIAYPLIRNCRFYRNTALNSGGAIFILAGSAGSVAPRLWNCRFEQNRALQSGGAVYRSGSSWQEVRGDFKDCFFVQNTAGGSGGGIFFADAKRLDTLEIIGCTFIQNFAKSLGGAIYTPGGRSAGTNLQLSKSVFIENKAKIGGCLSFYSEDFPLAWMQIDSCQFSNNHIFRPFPAAVAYASDLQIYTGGFSPAGGAQMFIQNCLFEADTTTDGTSEISTLEGCSIEISYNEFIGVNSLKILADDILFAENYWRNNIWTPRLQTNPFSNTPRTLIINNILVDNSLSSFFYVPSPAIFAGNLFINNTFGHDFLPPPNPPSPQFRRKSIFYNNIFWNNRPAAAIPGYTWQIPFQNDSSYFYNNLFDFESCDSLPSLYFCASGNLFKSDPLFSDTSAGDFRLLPCSPAIGAGVKGVYEQLGILTDLAGQARIQDGQVDIGPLESPGLAPWQPAVLTLPCSGTASGKVQFFLANGCEPLLVQWQKGSESGSGTTGLEPGQYRFTVMDQQGKLWQDSITLGPAPAPTVSDSIRAATCVACADGAIDIDVSPPSIPWRYVWSTGDTARNITNLLPGNYTLTLTDSANDCIYIYTYTVSWSSRSVEKPEYRLQLVPNPAAGVVWLQGAHACPVNVFLFDADGRSAKSWYQTAPSTWLELTGLPPGVYAFQILDGQNMLGRGRLAILR